MFADDVFDFAHDEHAYLLFVQFLDQRRRQRRRAISPDPSTVAHRDDISHSGSPHDDLSADILRLLLTGHVIAGFVSVNIRVYSPAHLA